MDEPASLVRARKGIGLLCSAHADIRVRFNRAQGALATRSWREQTGVRLMRLAQSAVAPFGGYGISHLHSLVGRLFSSGSLTEVVLDGQTRFVFPSGDYYWNRLLDPAFQYEPEIHRVLEALRSSRYLLLDLGANFGYWSCIGGSAEMGAQAVVAVEPAPSCEQLLRHNLAPMGGRARIVTHAIDQVSGRRVPLYGDRHAGASLRLDWYGHHQRPLAEVETITIDDLLTRLAITPADQPVLIKLDVEGFEQEALSGATETLRGDVALIIEDAEPDGLSLAVRRLWNELGFSFLYWCDGAYREARSLEELARMKPVRPGHQAFAMNLLAFRDQRWRTRFGHLMV